MNYSFYLQCVSFKLISLLLNFSYFCANTSQRQDLFDSKRTLQINIVVTSETLFMLNIVALFQTNRRKFLSEPDGLNANIEDLHYKFMSATFVIIVTSCLVSLSKHVGICLS